MVWRWSKTAATNATADSTINWAEGMAPSAVNDSARAEMARVAQYRDDIAGAIVTTGTSTAYAVSSNQVFDTLAHLDGAMIAFTPHATNTGTLTLNVDSLGAKPLRGAPSVELPSGALILGTPYVATYNNTDGVWYLHNGISNPYSIPLGGGIEYYASTAPNSAFALPYGQAISRTTYATLFSIVSTFYGSGDGSTTFNLPDLRGRVAVCPDNMGGSAAGRITGAVLTSVGGAQTVTISQDQLPNVAPTFTGTPSQTVSVSSANQVPQNIGTVNVGSTGTPVTVLAFGSGAQNFLPSSGSFTATGSVSSINGGVTQVATNNLQPYIAVNKIMRII